MKHSAETLGEFVLPLLTATYKLRAALDAGEGVRLDLADVKVIIDALKLLATKKEEA